MRVVVAGGGIGGLACAQGLRTHGIDVVVVERDADLSLTGGYKLHLGPPALRALRQLLPASGIEALLGSAVSVSGFALVVRDHRGRHLIRTSDDSAEVSLDVDRITLRAILAAGLEDELVLGQRCERWRTAGGGVQVDLDDGTVLEADLLVIADGAGSRLAAALAGNPTSRSCGLTGIAGRTAWDELPPGAQQLLGADPMLAVGPGGAGLFASRHDPVGDAAIHTDLAAPATHDPIAIWGLLAVDALVPEDCLTLAPAALQTVSTRLLDTLGWKRELVDLVHNADESTVAAFRLNAADPRRIAPWPASRVTALGDAVHAMPPTGGQGAATAILDAADLVDALVAADEKTTTALVAVHDYEARMRVRGASAVRESLEPVQWIRRSATPLGSVLTRALAPVAATGAAIGRVLRGGGR